MVTSIKVRIINALECLTFSLAFDVTMVVQLIDVSTSKQYLICTEYKHQFVEIYGFNQYNTAHILWNIKIN